jgi:hypothetical protein
LLLHLLRWFTPASRTEHIQKYSSIEKFIKLPFQWVLIRLNPSPNEGAMVVSLQHCLLSRISACATIGDSAISVCRNLWLPCRLICWNVDFMELLKIQIYPIVFCWGCGRHLDDIIIFFVHWQTNLILYYDKEYTRYGVTRYGVVRYTFIRCFLLHRTVTTQGYSSPNNNLGSCTTTMYP